MTFEEFIKVMSGRVKDAVGAVRVSLGIATNFDDVYHFVQFAKHLLTGRPDSLKSRG